jgi:hypothetical protein
LASNNQNIPVGIEQGEIGIEVQSRGMHLLLHFVFWWLKNMCTPEEHHVPNSEKFFQCRSVVYLIGKKTRRMMQRFSLPNMLILLLILCYTYTILRRRTTNSKHKVAVHLIAIREARSEYKDWWTEELINNTIMYLRGGLGMV